MTDSHESYIELNNVSFSYPKKDTSIEQEVISDVSLKLSRKDFTFLVGDNGSGKTTFGKLITGLLRLKQGTILIDGVDIGKMDLSAIGRKIGYLFQNPERQIFATSVYDDISFPLRYQGIDEKLIEQKTEQIMHDLEIHHLKDKYPFNLSHGEKQRVALAGVLIHDVKFLVLDEPTTALDAYRKKALGRCLEQIKDRGVGLLVISHDEEFTEKHQTRKLTMVKNGVCHE